MLSDAFFECCDKASYYLEEMPDIYGKHAEQIEEVIGRMYAFTVLFDTPYPLELVDWQTALRQWKQYPDFRYQLP